MRSLRTRLRTGWKLSDSSLPVCGKLNDTCTMTSGPARNRSSRAGPASSPAASRLANRSLARLDSKAWQDDEEVAGDEGDDERVARPREEIANPDARQRGDQTREHPERDDQRHRDVSEQVNLDLLQLLDCERAGRNGGNREQPVGCEVDDGPGRLGDHRRRRREHLEERPLLFDADERHADDDREQHDRGDNVVGQRVEGVRGDVERNEVEGRALLDEGRAEERRRLRLRERRGASPA